MKTILDFLHLHWPWFVGALPSIVVALTKIDTLPKWMSTLLQVASVLSHKNEPEMTLKLPGMTAAGHKRLMRKGTVPIVMVLFLAMSIAGCPKPIPGPGTPDAGTSDGKSTVTMIVDCVKKAAVEDSIISAVGNALVSGNFVALDALALQYGIDVVACVVRQVAGEAAMSARLAPGDVNSQKKADNGHAWMAKRGIQFAPAPVPHGG